jgi:predicted DNA-binding transcriptional regulator AlpA
MRQHPPSFGIVSRDCYDANLLAALRAAQARAEAAEADNLVLGTAAADLRCIAERLEARVRELEEVLQAQRELHIEDVCECWATIDNVTRVEAAAVFTPRRCLRRDMAAAYASVSATKFDQWVSDGRMPRPKRIDGCVLWDVRALDLAFDALMDQTDGGSGWGLP